jgi:hypothetical protein
MSGSNVQEEETRNTSSILVEKPLGKRPFGRRRGWENNIKVVHRDVDCEAGRQMEVA